MSFNRIFGDGPAVTVVTTTRNRFGLLLEAVRSVRNQTISDWEMVIIDDCSTDNTGRDTVEQEIETDSRIRLVRLDRNAGMPGGRNAGLSLARGRYVTFLDDDDVYLPRRLEAALDAARDSAPVVVVSGFREDLNLGTKWTFRVPHYDNFYHALLKMTAVDVAGMTVRRDVFDEVGYFDDKIPRSDDVEMWLRIARQHPHFVVVDDPLYVLRTRHFGRKPALREMEERRRASEIIFDRHRDSYEKYRNIMSSRLQYQGTSEIMYGYPRQARRSFVRAIAADPTNLKAYLCLGVSFLGANAYRNIARKRAVLMNGR